MIDFNKNIKIELPNEYTGSERKKTVILNNGKQYLLKIPDPVRQRNKNISYINNTISEYIGCKIAKSIGLSVQNVILGEYKTEENKIKIVCACEDVRKENEYLSQISTLDLSYPEGCRNKSITINGVEKFAKNNTFVPEIEVLDFFYDQLILDALIGNPDRHTGNWGILTNKLTGKSRMSPIYDCGSSFSSLCEDNELNVDRLKSDVLNNSYAVLDNNNISLILNHYINSLENDYLNNRLLVVFPKIDVNEIYNIIDSIECISDKRKQYYKNFIDLSYSKILLKSYKRIEKEYILPFIEMDYKIDLKSFYNKVMKPLLNLPLYEKSIIKIAQEEIQIKRVSNKDFILVDANCFENYLKVDSTYAFIQLAYNNVSNLLSDDGLLKLQNEFEKKKEMTI